MKRTVRLTAVLALVLLIAVLASCGGYYNYMKKDLGKYITITRQDYTGIPIELTDSYEVTEEDIDQEIGLLRLANRTLVSSGMTSSYVRWGDTANIYYSGTRPQNGYEIQFEGGSNMGDTTHYALTIGSGTFIDGFEDGLIGVNPLKDCVRVKKSDNGRVVQAGTVVYLNVENYQFDDGTGEVSSGSFTNLRVDLANPGIFGALLSLGTGEDGADVSMAESLVGMKIGDTFDFGYLADWDTHRLAIDWNGDGNASERLAITGKITAVATETLVPVTATFPESYDDESLSGVTATFYVYVESLDRYSIPELTEAMIQAEFSDFEYGEDEDMTTAFRAYLLDFLTEEKKEERTSDIREKIFDYLKETVSFSGKYPKKALEETYDEQYEQAYSEYEYYNQMLEENYGYSYNSFEEYAGVMYELAEDVTVKEYLTEKSKEVVREELLIYSIAKAEGWDLTKAEYTEGAKEVIARFAKAYDMSEEKVKDSLGEVYIREVVLYEKVMDNLEKLCVITES